MRTLAALLLTVLLIARPAGARAQADIGTDLVVLGINALLGGATAGIARELNDGAFLEGLGGGAAGGAAVYVGKRLNTMKVDEAGLVGRMIGAVGTSMIRNSAAARPVLERIIVPVGPVSLYLTFAEEGTRVAPKLHLGRAIYLGRLIVDDDFVIDWSETASAGAPVFRGRGVAVRYGSDEEAGGVELLGAIAVSDRSVVNYPDEHALLSHERVHVVQDDFITIGWTDPVEDWLLGHIPFGDTIGRYVDTGVVYLGFAYTGVVLIPYEDRPWEIEADYLGGG